MVALDFPEWIPPAVVETAQDLHSQIKMYDTVGRRILAALVADPRMQRVWQELYRKKNSRPEEFLHPPCLSNASQAARARRQARTLRKEGGARNERDAELLEADANYYDHAKEPLNASKWTEQDRAAQLLFWHVFHNAHENKPVYLSEVMAKVDELADAAGRLRDIATQLDVFGLAGQVGMLREVAEDCDDEAHVLNPCTEAVLTKNNGPSTPIVDDPWFLRRITQDDQTRSLLIAFSIATTMLFGASLYGTIATIANVVLGRTDMTRAKAREIVRCSAD